jgi:hypothetical protein
VWTDVAVVEGEHDEISLYRGDDVVARFGRYDADVFLVDDED